MPPGGRRGARRTTSGELTTAQAGRALGFSAARVRQLIAAGRLRANRPGRDYILTSAEVRRFSRMPKLRPGRPRNPLRKRKAFPLQSVLMARKRRMAPKTLYDR